MFKELIFPDNIKNTPNIIMIIPATIFRLSVNWLMFSDNTLLIKTPKVENTIENPKTKNIVFITMLILFIWKFDFWSFLISVNVVPEIYAKKAGIIGKIHGAIKDPNPAENAISIVGSVIW
mgnify:FL=1